jgi:hypothetical protein
MSMKRIWLSWTIGFSVVVALMLAGNGGIAPGVVPKLLNPGLGPAALLGFGSHDLGAIVVALVADSILYGAAIYIVSILVEALRSKTGS